MAQLNFPQDRTELTPPGTGPLETGDTYTANGTTWVYNADVGAWGSGGGETASDIFLSRVNDDTAAGEITFEKLTTHEGGVSVTGALTEFNDGLNLQYLGSGVTDIAAWRNSGSSALLTFSTTEGDTDPVERVRIYTDGQVRFLGNSGGRIFVDANQVTSGYNSFIQQTNTGLEFSVTSNSRGFVFNTGSASTPRVEIAPSGITTFNQKSIHKEGLRVDGGDGSEKLTITGLTTDTSDSLFLHSKDCAQVQTFVSKGLEYKRFTLGPEGVGQANQNGRGIDFIVGPNQPVTDSSAGTIISFYSPTEDYDVNKEIGTASTIIQSIAGTDAEYVAGGNLKPVVFRISKSGTLSAGKFLSPAVFNYQINGVTGDAYFAGSVTCGTGVTVRTEVACQPVQGVGFPGAGNTLIGSRLQSSGVAGFSANHADATSFVTLFNRSNFNGTLISFRKNGEEKGSIEIDDSNITILGQTSDYRVKKNIQPFTSTVDKVKQINVVNFEYTDRAPGVIQEGFVAHELAEICPKAVVGTKDATEAIGTLVDYDGTVLETEVTEPSELEYTEETTDEYGVSTQAIRTRTWTATGTRPVYQGVDQTKLIPLLTKALQEVMQKNEDLEARIAALEGA